MVHSNNTYYNNYTNLERFDKENSMSDSELNSYTDSMKKKKAESVMAAEQYKAVRILQLNNAIDAVNAICSRAKDKGYYPAWCMEQDRIITAIFPKELSFRSQFLFPFFWIGAFLIMSPPLSILLSPYPLAFIILIFLFVLALVLFLFKMFQGLIEYFIKPSLVNFKEVGYSLYAKDWKIFILKHYLFFLRWLNSK